MLSKARHRKRNSKSEHLTSPKHQYLSCAATVSCPRNRAESKCVATSPQNCKSASLHFRFKMNLPLDSGEFCRYNCWGSGNKHDTFSVDNWPFLVNNLVLVVLFSNKVVSESDKANHQFHISCLMAGMCKALLQVRIPGSNFLHHKR
ncbi:hypothetical protein NC651_011978 [Populus alba x Populus x berolinensis]|nr:hypothetical protein NC651_011978 [Populus alba x Populus x berolinensis]